MATANTALRISELDFDGIRANLVDYLRNQAEFTDYDFTGSGMSVIIDLLSYNTHYMAMQLNLVGNEMFLDTAQIRASVLSHAKTLNYVPQSRLGARATVNIKVTPGVSEDNTATTLTLSRYTRFLSKPINGVTYNFVNLEANTATKANGTFDFANVAITQGESISAAYLVDQNNPKRRFTLPSANTDKTTITVSVQESDANTFTRAFTEATDITEISANSNVYFVEENSDARGSYSIYFGDGVLGRYLANNNIVRVNYLDTKGFAANKVAEFTAVDGVGSYSANVITTVVTSASAGAERESVESVRFKAPIFYSAQNRAVTTQDYNALLLRDYPNVEAINVWGGAENIPPVYGKVFISMKPVDNYEITELEKQRIIDEIIANRSVLTVFPEIVDPEYLYVVIHAKVNYNPTLTTDSEDEIKQFVRAAILDYKNTELTGFGSIFRESLLHRYIDNSHNAIISNDVDLFVQKRFEPTLNASKNYTLSFNIQLAKGGSLNKLYSYPSMSVTDALGISREVYIEEVPDSFTGIDSIHVVSQGQNYISQPTITITGDGSGANATPRIVNGKLLSATLTERGYNYSRATVAITGGGGSGATATAQLQARNGTLRLYYFKSNGEKVILNSSIGTIDYDTGEIVLSSLFPTAIKDNEFYDADTVVINVEPENETIQTIRNQLIDIDETDASSILITMVAED